jgi:hypothetical protein
MSKLIDKLINDPIKTISVEYHKNNDIHNLRKLIKKIPSDVKIDIRRLNSLVPLKDNYKFRYMNDKIIIGKSYYNPVNKNKQSLEQSDNFDDNLDDSSLNEFADNESELSSNKSSGFAISISTQTDKLSDNLDDNIDNSSLNESADNESTTSISTQTDKLSDNSSLNESTSISTQTDNIDDKQSDIEDILSHINILSDTLNSHINQYSKHKSLIHSSFETIMNRLKALETDDANIYKLYNKFIAAYKEESTNINTNFEKLNNDIQLCKQVIQMIANQCNINLNQC